MSANFFFLSLHAQPQPPPPPQMKPLTLPEMAYGAVDIHVCIVQVLVITNYKLISIHEYHYFWHIYKNITFYLKLTVQNQSLC